MADQHEAGTLGYVPITVGLLALVASLFLIIFYINAPDQRSVLSFVAAVVAAAGGVTAAYYVGAGVREAARSQAAARDVQARAHQASLDQHIQASKVDRVFMLAARWSDPALSPARNTMSRLLESYRKTDVGPEERVRDIESAIEREAEADRDLAEHGVLRSLRISLDFLELVALAVNAGTVDEELTRRFFGSIIVKYAQVFGPWIKDRRDRIGQPRLNEELFRLADRWN
jgi:hypothetical protein